MHEKYNIQMHEKHIDKLFLFSKRDDHNAKHWKKAKRGSKQSVHMSSAYSISPIINFK